MTGDRTTRVPSDDDYRRAGAAKLTRLLDESCAMLLQCYLRARQSDEDMQPVYAAARLLNANARIAQSLANLAQVEQRRRTIIERVQTPDPKRAELNSKNEIDVDALFAALQDRAMRLRAKGGRKRLPKLIDPNGEAALEEKIHAEPKTRD